MWDEITYLFPNFSGCTLKFPLLKFGNGSNFNPHFIMYNKCDYLSMVGLKLIHVSKRDPESPGSIKWSHYMFTRNRQIGAGTGHRHGHSEERRGYQDTPILQWPKHRKTRFDVKICDLLLQKLPILIKPLRISSKIICQRVHNNVFCSRAQTTCWIFVCWIYENLPRWTTYESPSIYSRKRAILLRCNTLM